MNYVNEVHQFSLNAIWVFVAIIAALILIIPSIRIIGPTEVGLVIKRFSFKKLREDNPIAFKGEAGYQADLLMPGWRFKFWVVYSVTKFPWVQVPAGEIGVVIAQIGSPIPIGAKSAIYKKEFGNFANARTFVENGGQKGVQRPVLSPGTLAPIHPVGFLVITKANVYGIPIDSSLTKQAQEAGGKLTVRSFSISPDKSLTPDKLNVTRIESPGQGVDVIGIVTAYEGDPLPAGDIASRLGGFSDLEQTEKGSKDNTKLIETLLGSKNNLHNNYQDFQAFLDNGGKIGLQHDPLLYGAYNLNPFLISVEVHPMLVVEQGEVAVIKAYVGLMPLDTSGAEFKFGTLVKPGHRGIWEEPLRTGKYPINPHCYKSEIVPTSILTLNWAEATSQAHLLDKDLKSIVAKSREGFVFTMDLQVQIHITDIKAPKVISIVGTMRNLVSEVLQAAVGNHFRDRMQALQAIKFIETRQQVQEDAFLHIKKKLEEYEVETKGVYIQDVILPDQLVKVLTEREIANQQIEMFKKQRESQDQRILTEAAKGTADMQAELAKSKVGIDIKQNNADARKAEADGEASYIRQTGEAEGLKLKAIGMANAEAYKAQVNALGQTQTAIINAVKALAEQKIKVVPDILVAGGGSSIEGLAATLMKYISAGKSGSTASK
jgi:hypothetical protein